MADPRQLDVDYSNTIANLKAKHKRQVAAAQQTEIEIQGFLKLQEQQAKPK